MAGGIFFEEFEVSTEKYIGQPSDSHRQIAPLAYIKGCIPLRCLSELVRCFTRTSRCFVSLSQIGH